MKKTLTELIEHRIQRRELLSLLGGSMIISCAKPQAGLPEPRLPQQKRNFSFSSVSPTLDEMHHVSEGYEVDIVLSWGDPIFSELDTPFSPQDFSAQEQEQRFGYNCDYISCLPQENGNIVLCINHESTVAQMMFDGEKGYSASQKENIEVEMMAHGMTIVELSKQEEHWSVVYDSPLNRRITAQTPTLISGPVAGHERMKTPDDPTGTKGKGTVHNCSGGTTPWGTILTCEENILYYFMGDRVGTPQEEAYARYNIGYSKGYRWGEVDSRFQLAHAPNEPNRFGWVVEVDPKKPQAPPIKRTALGRIYHESANPILAEDGRVVIYMGDDGYFEYLYRYLSDDAYEEGKDTSTLLDKGVLSVAKLHEDGTLTWIPLIHGQGPLTKENGFSDQGDVLIEARRAGDLVGATPMDRCEDVEPNQNTGKVYVNCTKNPRRGNDGKPSKDASNPRNHNEAGHIIELIPTNGHTADTMSWEILLLAGKDGQYGILEGSDTLGCPDNACIDPQHRLWISTDGSEETMGFCDALYAVETKRPFRGYIQRFFSAPKGAEITGPCFHPSGEELFLSVQHPGFVYGQDGNVHNCWPDFSDSLPPRPSVVCIRKKGGGIIGS